MFFIKKRRFEKMLFKLNVFGSKCPKCEKPFKPSDWVSFKGHMKVGNDGEIITSTGFIEIYHKNCI